MLMQNPYSGIDMYLPANVYALKDSLVAASGAGKTAAFKRQIDLWWMCMVIGVHIDKRVKPESAGQLTKFNSGSILDSDPWRIVHIELLVMGVQGFEILANPNGVMATVSEYAYGGAEWLAEHLRDQPSALAELSRLLTTILVSQDEGANLG